MRGWTSRLLARLGRETASGEFVAQIDGLRFFAVAAVLLYHINGYVREKGEVTWDVAPAHDPVQLLFSRGFIGVQLFFAISGFVLALPFASAHLLGKTSPQLGRYYLRRLTRLEPPYFANLLVLTAALVAIRHMALREVLPHLLASAGYCHNLVYGEGSLINTGAWSLEIEVQFYLLAPLLARVFLVRPTWLRRAVLAAGILALGARQYAWGRVIIHSDALHGLTLLDQAHFFLVGFLLVDLFLMDWKTPSTSSTAWDVAATLAWAAIFPALYFDWIADVTVPILVFVAYAGAFRGRLWPKIVSTRVLFTIGGMCYTIYLYHPFLVSLAARFTIRVHVGRSFWINDLLQFALIVPFVLVCSAGLFALLERPFMRRDWPTRLWSWARGGATQQPGGSTGPSELEVQKRAGERQP